VTNLDPVVVESFGKEWSKFNQGEVDPAELRAIFDTYFAIFPWDALPAGAEGFDLGCGSGRWAYYVSSRVGRLHCIDPSPEALNIARRNLSPIENCEFHCASVEAIPFPDGSFDFGYSVGVLHHVPDPQKGVAECTRKLKPGAPFLIYLYYAFDNRPLWFRALWRASDLLRRLVSKLPFKIKSPLCDLLAALVYWPLARTGRLLEWFGLKIEHLPLSAYRNRSFYLMRNDALDRFGTRVERRFARAEIRQMMEQSGLERITFSESPCWCAVGYKNSFPDQSSPQDSKVAFG